MALWCFCSECFSMFFAGVLGLPLNRLHSGRRHTASVLFAKFFLQKDRQHPSAKAPVVPFLFHQLPGPFPPVGLSERSGGSNYAGKASSF